MVQEDEPLARTAIIIALASALVAGAAEAEWFSNGPFCAQPIAFTAGPTPTSDAYLSVRGRIFRSRDGWRSWQEVESVLPPHTTAPVPLAADPADPERVFAGIWREGVYRSEDGGAHWERFDSGLPPNPAVGLIYKPDASTQRVFAKTFSFDPGFFRSDDLGATWDEIELPAGGGVTPPHPRNADRFWAVSSRNLWWTDDGGDSWVRGDDGLPVDRIDLFTVDPDDPTVAFAVDFRDLYRTDDARNWSLVGDGGQLPVAFGADALVALPGDPPRLLVGDRAEALFPTGEPGPSVHRSLDGGLSWQGGLIGENVFELLYHAGTGRAIALTGSGAFVSEDLGTSWKRTGAGVDVGFIAGLAVAGDPERPALVATIDACDHHSRFARSEDGGRTWEVGGPFERSEAGEILAAPSDLRRVYARMRVLRRSDDGGSTWQSCGGHSQRRPLAIHPADPDVVYAGAFGSLDRSLDGCQTWEEDIEPLESIAAVAFDPSDPDRIFVASGFRDGVARSRDGGETWHRLDPLLEGGSLTDVAVDPHDPDVVLVASSNPEGLVYRSADGGDTWAPASAGLDGVSLYDLAFDPLTPGLVVAAASGDGVYRSVDGGTTWEPWPDTPDDWFAHQVVFDPRGRVFARVSGRGVYSPVALTQAEPCRPDAHTACLFDGEFEVSGATWDFGFPPAERPLRVMAFPGGRAESDQAVFFESFSPGNFEIGVKMVDGCGLEPGHPNRAYWVFAGGLTNTESEVVIEDTATGAVYRWHNPAGRFPRSVGDTGAFPCFEGTPSAPCVRDSGTACLLGGRFRVTGVMHDFSDPPRAVPARVMHFSGARAESAQAVFFDSFTAGNFEVGVKMVDACALAPGNPLRAYWAFYGGLTNAEAQVVITQRATGEIHEWSNRGGTFALTEGDTGAFPCLD